MNKGHKDNLHFEILVFIVIIQVLEVFLRISLRPVKIFSLL